MNELELARIVDHAAGLDSDLFIPYEELTEREAAIGNAELTRRGARCRLSRAGAWSVSLDSGRTLRAGKGGTLRIERLPE